ncbi:MAG: hypothetical protein AAGM67_13440, partial [Bacteroidota bacterium]
MMLYLSKVILGSGLLWLLYRYRLQGVRMFRFNRVYLLLALATAYAAPLLPLHPAREVKTPIALPNWSEVPMVVSEPAAATSIWRAETILGLI